MFKGETLKSTWKKTNLHLYVSQILWSLTLNSIFRNVSKCLNLWFFSSSHSFHAHHGVLPWRIQNQNHIAFVTFSRISCTIFTFPRSRPWFFREGWRLRGSNRFNAIIVYGGAHRTTRPSHQLDKWPVLFARENPSRLRTKVPTFLLSSFTIF